MQFYTYLHCKPNGDPFYVGKGSDKYTKGHGVDRRSHSKKNRNKHHRNITAKYGWENVLVYIFPCESEAQALADEIQQIAQLRREGCILCNITAGGEGCSGMTVTAETRLKIAAALRGVKQMSRSAEWRAKLSTANKGKVPPPHVIQAAAEAQKRRRGVKRPAEHFGASFREKQSAAKKGVPWSDARREAQNKRSLNFDNRKET